MADKEQSSMNHAETNLHYLEQDLKRNNGSYFEASSEQSATSHVSDRAWKPLCRIEQRIGEKEKLKRNVQAVLNKLTFQKFKILLSQLKKLNIDTEEELELVVNLIYENAIIEPHFCILYANLCKHLTLKMPFDNATTAKEFSVLLLNKCKAGFEERCDQDSYEVSLLHLQENKRVKSRRIGNIRFIGELFKFKMISNATIFEWIESLLAHDQEDSLELFFWLMKTSGKELELQEKDVVHGYFQQIQSIIDNRRTSSRIRFLLQDIVDLRENNWVPRRLENIPKTIDEIHKEAALEFQRQSKIHQGIPNHEEKSDEKKLNIACHSSCSCEESTSQSFSNRNFASNRANPKLSPPAEVKSLLFGRDLRKQARKGRSKKKPSSKSQHNPDNQGSSSSKPEE